MPIFGVIKHDKGVYLVNESVFVFGDETLIDEHNLLTFTPKGTHHTFISVRPDPYLAQIINDIDNLLPKDIDHNFNKSYLLHEFIPKINQQFLNLGLLKMVKSLKEKSH